MEDLLRWIVGAGPIIIAALVYILPSASERAKNKDSPPVVQGKTVDMQAKFVEGLEKDVQQESFIAELKAENKYLKRILDNERIPY